MPGALWRAWSLERTLGTEIRQTFAIWQYTTVLLTQFLLATVQLKLNLIKGSGICSCTCYMYLAELERLLPWGAGGEQRYHRWRRGVCIITYVKILKVNCLILPLNAYKWDLVRTFAFFRSRKNTLQQLGLLYRVRLSI